MKRLVAIFLAVAVCCTLSVAAVAFYIDLTYPNYHRDASVPSIYPGVIFGAPVGLLLGLVVGAVWPLKRS
jgi:hypothetical protein